MKHLSVFVSIAALSASIASTASAGELSVKLTGIAQTKGEIMVTIFNQKTPWLKQALVSQKVVAKGDTVEVAFSNLPDGEYAVSAIHDLNGNGHLDTNAIGMPTEPYGFSNDAAGNFGPPSFEQAKFSVDQAKKSISFRIN